MPSKAPITMSSPALTMEELEQLNEVQNGDDKDSCDEIRVATHPEPSPDIDQQLRRSARTNKGKFTTTRFADENYEKQTTKRTAYFAKTANSEPEPQTFDEAVNHSIYGKKWRTL